MAPQDVHLQAAGISKGRHYATSAVGLTSRPDSSHDRECMTFSSACKSALYFEPVLTRRSAYHRRRSAGLLPNFNCKDTGLQYIHKLVRAARSSCDEVAVLQQRQRLSTDHWAISIPRAAISDTISDTKYLNCLCSAHNAVAVNHCQMYVVIGISVTRQIVISQ